MQEISVRISGCSVYIPNERLFINAVSSTVGGAGLLEPRQLAWSLHYPHGRAAISLIRDTGLNYANMSGILSLQSNLIIEL